MICSCTDVLALKVFMAFVGRVHLRPRVTHISAAALDAKIAASRGHVNGHQRSERMYKVIMCIPWRTLAAVLLAVVSQAASTHRHFDIFTNPGPANVLSNTTATEIQSSCLLHPTVPPCPHLCPVDTLRPQLALWPRIALHPQYPPDGPNSLQLLLLIQPQTFVPRTAVVRSKSKFLTRASRSLLSRQ